MTVAPRTAFHVDHPCELAVYHAPVPVMTNYHHTKPQYLQERLWGEVRFGPDMWVCSNCHDSVHAWLYWLLGEHRQPPHVGHHAKAAAVRTYSWYQSEVQGGGAPSHVGPPDGTGQVPRGGAAAGV